MHAVVTDLNLIGFTDYAPVKLGENAEAFALRGLLHDSIIDTLLTIKGLPNYIPLMIPYDPAWLQQVQARVAQSFQHLIADVWTQLLVSRMDSKEKPIYLLWDHEVPKPTPASALAWLLICEAWPMPTHRGFDADTPLRKVFPHQPFLLPQSSLYGFSGFQPMPYQRGGFLLTEALKSHEPLTGLLSRTMTRTDRENMALVAEHHPIHRPHRATVTGYGFYMSPGFEREYSLMPQWPTKTNLRADHGYGAHEIIESSHHLNDLIRLRREVMSGLVRGPGLGTHSGNLHNPVGSHIRFISEEGLHLSERPKLPWTIDDESIKLEHGLILRDVPLSMPRTWFGFTKTGDDDSDPEVKNATTEWAATYGLVRHYAIEQLLNTDRFTDHLAKEAIERRGQLLKKSGRIKTKQTSVTHFADAFKKALSQNIVPDSTKGEN